MKITRDFNHSKWSHFVAEHPDGNIFQTPEMYEVYAKTRNYEPVFIGAVDEHQEYTGVLLAVIQKEYFWPVDLLTSRSIIQGGPLVRDNDPDILDALIEEYDRIAKRKAIYTQFRNLWNAAHLRDPLLRLGYAHEEHLNILIDLSKSEDQLWSEVHKKRRNEIRRASREGTEAREITQEADIRQAYRILTEVYQNAKLPLADISLFLAAWEILAPKNMVRYVGAYHEGRLIGVICVLCFGDTIIDWYAGSQRASLNKYPNDLLPWEVFKWGKSQGFLVFDFGGAGKPDKEYGVRDYKKKFGGEFVNWGRFEKIHQPLMFRIGETGFKIWRTLKT